MRARLNRLSVLKKFAPLIGSASCLSRPSACGGFLDGTNVGCLFESCVCYVYVLCYVRFAEKAEKLPKRSCRIPKVKV